jgi:hypothetical protein
MTRMAKPMTFGFDKDMGSKTSFGYMVFWGKIVKDQQCAT